VRFTACSEYAPGRKSGLQFRSIGLVAGLAGRHWFEVFQRQQSVLRHVIEASCDFRTWIFWTAVVKPLHNALLEDALDGPKEQ